MIVRHLVLPSVKALAASGEEPHVKDETVMVIGGPSLMEDSQPVACLVSWELFG